MSRTSKYASNHLKQLCYERLAELLLKYQLRQALSAQHPTYHLPYNKNSDDAGETVPVVGSLALREPIVPHNAIKILSSFTTPSTPPIYVVEVGAC